VKISATRHGDVTVLELSGELNHESAGRFNEAVAAAFNAGCRDFAVDLRQVNGIDSAGLEAFTALQRRCEEQLGMVRFCGPDATLKKIFELTRLDRSLAVEDSLDEALASFA